MFNVFVKILVGILAGVGLLTLGKKLLNKYYESLADEDAEFDIDEFGDEDEMQDEIIFAAPTLEDDEIDTDVEESDDNL